jgi:hypothetical protein
MDTTDFREDHKSSRISLAVMTSTSLRTVKSRIGVQ